MNKRGKGCIIIVALIIIIAVLSVLGMFVFTKNKTPITAEEFRNKMEEKEFIIGNATEQFTEQAEYIKKVCIAASKDITYQIEFYEMSDVDSAQSFFNTNKQIFENSKGNVSSENSVNLKNYSTYTLSTNGKYKYISRVENTVVYLNVDDTYKDEVKDIIKDLGY